jgi:anti-anti-sigma regulatory factor
MATMFQIRRSEEETLVVFALSGRIEEEHLTELKKLLEMEAGAANAKPVALDLTDVKLVHREAVKFLATCEAGGMELKSCPSYVREWIGKGKG